CQLPPAPGLGRAPDFPLCATVWLLHRFHGSLWPARWAIGSASQLPCDGAPAKYEVREWARRELVRVDASLVKRSAACAPRFVTANSRRAIAIRRSSGIGRATYDGSAYPFLLRVAHSRLRFIPSARWWRCR